MAIVLPHGVLFRGKYDDDSEGTIRKTLIEKDQIETIIGLPSNIFYGTGIPTIIMILKKERPTSDILFIDASKGFVKEGNKNKLRDCDIKKVVDTAINRIEIPKYSRLVSKEEIRKNEYNLNIPRYVDSSEDAEEWDIYGIMNGNIPNAEIDKLENYWKELTSLKNEIFEAVNSKYSVVKEDYETIIRNNVDVKKYDEAYRKAFADFDTFLIKELIGGLNTEINIHEIEERIIAYIFDKTKDFKLVDQYSAYQAFADNWKQIGQDLDNIKRSGKEVITEVGSIYEFKDGEMEAVGEEGEIIPLDLVKSFVLKDDSKAIADKQDRIAEIDSELKNLISEMDSEDVENVTNEDHTEFDKKALETALKETFEEINNGDIGVLKQYIELLDNKANKKEKLDYMNSSDFDWDKIEKSKDGTCSKKNVNAYLSSLYKEYSFEENSYEAQINKANSLIEEQKHLNKDIKSLTKELNNNAKDTLKNMDEDTALNLLNQKWIVPVSNKVMSFTEEVINYLIDKVDYLSKKYEVSYKDTLKNIKTSNNKLFSMLNDLTGNEYDMKGIEDLMSLLGGEEDE